MNENNDGKKNLKHLEGHSLVSRRDFISHGLLAGMGTVMMPSLLSILKVNAAMALDCGPAAGPLATNNLPVLIFDLSGGSNIAGSNVMVGGKGGQMDFLAAYNTLGLPADMHPKNAGQISSELGLAFHSDSAILRGIQASSQATTRAKVEGGVFCTISNDDTQNNPHNPMYWLTKAGAQGDVTQMVGTQNTTSGGNSMAPQASIIPTLKPVTINTPKDALNLVTIGKLGTLFGQDKSNKILKAMESMSAQRLKQFDDKSLPEQIRELINCGYLQSQDALNKFLPQNIDPTLDANVTASFSNLNDGNQRKTATIAKMLLDGHIGVGTVTLGGYDYHTDDRAAGELKDFDAGDLIGRVLELAAKKQKNILVYVITVGGVSSNSKIDSSINGRGKLAWGGDSGNRSSSFMLFYRQAGRATLRNANTRQIGAFLPNQNVDPKAALTSNSVTNLSKAVVANYLALLGKESILANVVGDDPFGKDLEKYLIFNKAT